ncbi:hypothetical protein [Kitasatospora acidiphila]|uniref:hypothetical protein n=1 Tax=Kitasatospora acidiphila TaxID=2567942 RepID=UPI003C73AE9D
MRDAPGRDYPFGSQYQPDERAPQMTPAQLTAVRDAAVSVAGRRGVHRFDDVFIYNEPHRRDVYRLLARGLTHKALGRLKPKAAAGR